MNTLNRISMLESLYHNHFGHQIGAGGVRPAISA